jgi:hypothetical protein
MARRYATLFTPAVALEPLWHNVYGVGREHDDTG